MNLLELMGFLVFTFLSMIMSITVASPTSNPSINHLNKYQNITSINKSPYWEYVLREFVFKTISSPPQTSNILYKKLLEAPFYGGPLSTTSNEDNVLLSRGDVYHLPDGQWILCQENCNDCLPCSNQYNSIVKWTLRRVKHFISPNSYRYDLQLTVIPQLNDGTFQNFPTGNYIYVPYETIISQDTSPSAKINNIDQSRSRRSWRRVQNDEYGQNDQLNNINKYPKLPTKQLNSLSATNYRRNTTVLNNFESTNRLIMGIDQSGKKHVIHVVSIDPSDIQLNQNINAPTYQQYVNKLLETINSNRPIIQAFLSYNQRKNENLTSSFHPVYTEFINNNNNNNNTDRNTNFNFKIRKENHSRDWSQMLTRMPRSKNYIPKLIKKFNGNLTNIIRSQSINLF